MTTGIDNVPSFKKKLSAVSIQPLLTLFNLALSTFKYPGIWKTARICPVFKSLRVSIIIDPLLYFVTLASYWKLCCTTAFSVQ